jgi:AraC-like DNA-binding protein
MLTARTILDRDALTVADVACSHDAGRGDEELNLGHKLVFVRRGYFLRSADGVESLVDPTLAYWTNPGDEQRIDHPHSHGDDCTVVSLDAELVASLWGGEAMLPPGPLPVSPDVDLGHRLLLSAGLRGADPAELEERAIALAATSLEQADARRVASGRPSTEHARRALADGARELLAEEPGRSLPELARALAVSPHHLSRVFHAITGHTISRHRMRLRARAAMERMAGGDGNLARMAADLGFADQGHLCRVVRAETGEAPSVLRRVLSARS